MWSEISRASLKVSITENITVSEFVDAMSFAIVRKRKPPRAPPRLVTGARRNLERNPCCNAASPDRSRRQTHTHAKRHRAHMPTSIKYRRKRFHIQKRRVYYFRILRTFSRVIFAPRAPHSHYTDTIALHSIPATPFTAQTLIPNLPTS